ncbi:MAG TPA: hypothetical protein ENK43_17275 [Planctomycetes bacterium]|nr:hypothetical protein [Planctomycetota bacterium]
MTRSLLLALSVLLALSSGALLVHAASRAAPDSSCTLVAQYDGHLGDDATFTGRLHCSGRCPTSGRCRLQFVNPPAGWAVGWTCACRSGGDSQGCRGVLLSRTTVQGDDLERLLVCLGPCDDGDICDWSSAATPRGRTGNWARCGCQPSE